MARFDVAKNLSPIFNKTTRKADAPPDMGDGKPLVAHLGTKVSDAGGSAETTNGRTDPHSNDMKRHASDIDERNKRPEPQNNYETRVIAIELIRTNPSVQVRLKTTRDVIEDYAVAMREGAEFPPLVVFQEGEAFVVGDGFHRLAAARQAGLTNLNCELRPGGIREARLFAAGANATHGLPRTNEDKRSAVMRLLNDQEWCGWSDRSIARHCHVGHQLVGDLRQVTGRPTTERKCLNKHNSVITMKTDKIGQTKNRSAVPRQENLPRPLDAPSENSQSGAGETETTAAGANELNNSTEAVQAEKDAPTYDVRRILRELTQFITSHSARADNSIVITIAADDLHLFYSLLDRVRLVTHSA
jgi:hypothetical protein